MSSQKRIGNYLVSDKIGSGAFATVFLGEHVLTGDKVAIKAISRQKLNQKLQENLELEISILQALDHPNVVKLYEILKSDNRIYLVLEYCAGGDLSAFIRHHGKCSEDTAKYYISQLASGLRFMRSHNVMHRDLKPQNLLLTDSHPPVLKIADFGFARSIKEGNMAETLCGSPLYMAPEVLQYKQYDAKVDLWAVGAILYELLAARPPFPARNHKDLVEKIQRYDLTMPPGISSDCLAVLSNLLVPDPTHRISYEMFFASPFLDTHLLNVSSSNNNNSNNNSNNSSTSSGVFRNPTAPISAPPPPTSTPINIASLSPSPTNHMFAHSPSPWQSPPLQPAIPEEENDPSGISRAVKVPKINPFKASLPGDDGDLLLSPSVLSQLGLRSPLFSLFSLFPSATATDIEEFRRTYGTLESTTRTGALLCDLADIKSALGSASGELLMISLRGLDLLSNAILRIHATPKATAGPVRAMASELLSLLHTRYLDMLHKADQWGRELKPSSSATTTTTQDTIEGAERPIFEHAVEVAREAAVDELLGHFAMAFERYEVAIVLTEFLVSSARDDGDRAVLVGYTMSFKQRRAEIVKKLSREQQQHIQQQQQQQQAIAV